MLFVARGMQRRSACKVCRRDMQDTGKGCVDGGVAGLRSDLRLKGTGYGNHEYLLVPRCGVSLACAESQSSHHGEQDHGSGAALHVAFVSESRDTAFAFGYRGWQARGACTDFGGQTTVIACGPIIREARIRQDRSQKVPAEGSARFAARPRADVFCKLRSNIPCWKRCIWVMRSAHRMNRCRCRKTDRFTRGR